ncbi:sulfotransferase family 5A, member 1 isoform X2 [Hemitrygon akajei]|uniref:sulfotransferase family 5A, member 1 isoform X2 n=1 Tax=Hemitrygon akajei TaxID=2704970 RepID=UPI003BF9F947
MQAPSAMANLNVTIRSSGIDLPGHLHTPKSLQYAQEFQFQDTDTVIITYPKSGTTWMQEILTLIYSDGDMTPAKTIPNWLRTPWIEQYYCENVLMNKSDHRILTTHLPYHFLAKSLKQSNAKVIYVARNPKDIVVSYYHFHKIANFLPEPGTFGEFLEKFLIGEGSEKICHKTVQLFGASSFTQCSRCNCTALHFRKHERQQDGQLYTYSRRNIKPRKRKIHEERDSWRLEGAFHT